MQEVAFTLADDERLPPDPSGINEPHDVLAAEEFAMPAGGETQSGGQSPIPEPRTLVPLIVLAAFAALLVLLARRRA